MLILSKQKFNWINTLFNAINKKVMDYYSSLIKISLNRNKIYIKCYANLKKVTNKRVIRKLSENFFVRYKKT